MKYIVSKILSLGDRVIFDMGCILVTGALGQIGSELTPALRNRYDDPTVVATDVRVPDNPGQAFDGVVFEKLDVTDRDSLDELVRTHDVDRIFHLAAILSAKGEEHPELAYDVNVNGLYNVLEVGRQRDVDQVIVPSSIAVFGRETPSHPSEVTILSPTTLYGISKELTERFAQYYADRWDLDVRGIRLPGVISYESPPGGGTTDYAVEVFYEALVDGEYTYYVREDTQLPMVYIPDAISALLDIADADESALRHRASYNVSSLEFTPADLTREIQRHLPEFQASYEPDERQDIADSWPETVDDTAARQDWDWNPNYDFETVVEDMLRNLSDKEVISTS